jgi:hypothetical protein
MNPRPAGRADWEIGAPIGSALQDPRLNLTCQKTCKTLLQVKQSFVILWKTLTPSRAAALR